MNKWIRALLVSVAIGLGAQTQAAVLFSDDFDTDSASSVLNFNGLNHWTVDSGTIDYIRSGDDFRLSCVGGTGGCVDMLGSTGTAGRLVSKQAFALSTDVMYTLEAEVSGNQRDPKSNEFTMGFINAATGDFVASYSEPEIPSDDPFSTRSFSITFFFDPTELPLFEVRLFIQSAGTNNMGPMLDNVSFFDNQVAVPEPGMLTLLGLGFLGLAASRSRRNQ